MGFVAAVKTCLRNYVTFRGRAARPEFWWFVLFVFLGSFVFALIDRLVLQSPVEGDSEGPLGSLFGLATLLPMLAVSVRRLHDTGRSGWWIALPWAIQITATVGLLLGVMTFGAIEQAGAEAETLRPMAGMFGMGGMMIVGIAMLGAAILMLWWLTRPSDPGPNAYGPRPSA